MLAELSSGYAVIGDVQFLPGYCVLLGKDPNAKTLADLPRAERVQFLADVDLPATAMKRACKTLDPAFRRANGLRCVGNQYLVERVAPGDIRNAGTRKRVRTARGSAYGECPYGI